MKEMAYDIGTPEVSSMELQRETAALKKTQDKNKNAKTQPQFNTRTFSAITPSELFNVTLEDLEKKKAKPAAKKKSETVKLDAPAKAPAKK
jgi:hypothetical protein